MPARIRIDRLLVERGLFESRAKAQAAIAAGLVTADDVPVAKPSAEISAEAVIRAEPAFPWVSRAGVKLAHALDRLGFDVTGRVGLDVGASTGGFTDCLLQRGAPRVAAVDVAYGQIDARLRKDRRVIVVERQNGRSLAPADLPFLASLATIDVSFISLTKILPAVASCLAPGGEVLAMVKPQFELEKGRVGRGVVRDPADRQEAILKVAL
ncbi:MAG: TlyA family RNA methyltransferase, partial [Xanthobacteraceae bacterium]